MNNSDGYIETRTPMNLILDDKVSWSPPRRIIESNSETLRTNHQHSKIQNGNDCMFDSAFYSPELSTISE